MVALPNLDHSILTEREIRVPLQPAASAKLDVALFHDGKLVAPGCEALNLSRGGMFLKTDSLFDRGSILDFKAFEPQTPAAIEGKGYVCWTSEPAADKGRPEGMGLSVLSFEKGSEQRWQQLISRNIDQLTVGMLIDDRIAWMDAAQPLGAALEAWHEDGAARRIKAVCGAGGAFIGLFDASRVMQGLGRADLLTKKVADFADTNYMALHRDSRLEEAFTLFTRTGTGCLAVVEGGRLCGVLSPQGIVPLWAEYLDLHTKRIKEHLARTMNLVVHDLAAPLSVIRTTGSLVSSGVMDAIDFFEEGMFQLIEDNCVAMTEMIDDLQALTRDDYDMARLKLENVDLVALTQSASDSFRAMATQKGIELLYKPLESPVMVPADRRRMRQILNNLISNAVKYSDYGDRVEVRLATAESHVTLTVSDSGQGIPAEELPHLFQEYCRASSRTTAGESSTGLGLCIAKRLVEAHRGTIEVISAVGRGTSLVVTLPICFSELGD